jgi:hypothetical protein
MPPLPFSTTSVGRLTKSCSGHTSSRPTSHPSKRRRLGSFSCPPTTPPPRLLPRPTVSAASRSSALPLPRPSPLNAAYLRLPDPCRALMSDLRAARTWERSRTRPITLLRPAVLPRLCLRLLLECQMLFLFPKKTSGLSSKRQRLQLRVSQRKPRKPLAYANEKRNPRMIRSLSSQPPPTRRLPRLGACLFRSLLCCVW